MLPLSRSSHDDFAPARSPCRGYPLASWLTESSPCVSRFALREFVELNFDNLFAEDAPRDPVFLERYRKHNVGQVAVLDVLGAEPPVAFVIGNTHLYWNPSLVRRKRRTLSGLAQMPCVSSKFSTRSTDTDTYVVLADGCFV
jgi:hypothetical protein